MPSSSDAPAAHPSELGTKPRTKREASRRLAELDALLPDHLPKADIDTLVEITTGIVAADLPAAKAPHAVSPVTGRPVPEGRRVVSAQRANLLRGFRLRRSLLRDALTATEVASLLGAATRQTPHDRVAAGTLVAVRDAGKLRFPIWQFDPEGPDGVVEGFAEVLGELPTMTQLGRVSWFVQPRRGLRGRSPIEALREHDATPVLTEARATHVA
jgi:hypothetical protein